MKNKFKNIVIVGGGYVGLSLACLFSKTNKVTIVDTDITKINSINNRFSYLDDPEIKKEIEENEISINATEDLSSTFSNTDLYILCLPTNYDHNKNFFDTSIIEGVLDTLVASNKYAKILIKSTIPYGFTKSQRQRFNSSRILFSPEFLREGSALKDNLYPSRIIIGDQTEQGREIANLFLSLAKNNPEVILMDSCEAEAVKLFSNTYLATRIGFFNELDSFCYGKKISASNVVRGVCSDPRIGDLYNNPSFGYGGYCLPKDTRQLNAEFDNIPQNIISSSISSNESRINYMIDALLELNVASYGIYKLAMKSQSDNFRSSATLRIVEALKQAKKNIIIYDESINEDSFYGTPVEKDLNIFKKRCSIIIANRIDVSLEDISDKVFSRDIYGRD